MSEQPVHDVAQALVNFSRALSDEQSVEAVFHTLGRYVGDLLDVDGVGILLLQNGDLAVATANNELGEVAEHLEADLAEGPCTDSIRTSRHVISPDLEADVDRWPTFAPRALAAGIRGLYALPMGGRSDQPIGAVNVVSARLRELSEQELRTADMLTEVAVSYLVSIQAHRQANELASQLQRALDSRVVIEQAKGLLAGRNGCSLPDAFETMRQYARNNNDTIRDVAHRICEGELDLS